jgi:putative alpha-1,2-mannosidase
MNNEPSFTIPWEYDYAGAPAQTQQVVRQIEEQLFGDGPAGLAGNDDLGAVSSWYVWSALGAYPEMPGSGDLALGSPLFPSITIDLPSGHTLTENAPAAAADAPYVDGLTLDGAPRGATYLPAGNLTSGATLRWALGTTPSAWGSAPGDAPPSDTRGLLAALGYLGGAGAGVDTVAPGGTATLSLARRACRRSPKR